MKLISRFKQLSEYWCIDETDAKWDLAFTHKTDFSYKRGGFLLHDLSGEKKEEKIEPQMHDITQNTCVQLHGIFRAKIIFLRILSNSAFGNK